jgi:lipoprotein NlpD
MFRQVLKSQKLLFILVSLRFFKAGRRSFVFFLGLKSDFTPAVSAPFVWLFLTVPTLLQACAEQEGWSPMLIKDEPLNAGRLIQAASFQAGEQAIQSMPEHNRTRKKKRVPMSSKAYYRVHKSHGRYSIRRHTGFGHKKSVGRSSLNALYENKSSRRLKLVGKKSIKTKADRVLVGKSSGGTGVRRRTVQTRLFLNDTKKNFKLRFIWPIQGKISKNFAQANRKGIDIAGKMGSLVRAAEAGMVIYSGQGLKRLGNLIILEHSAAYLTAYANNRRLLVTEKQIVQKGQPIAELGNSWSQKPVLHFEIRKNGKPVNPLLLLPAEK